jgi:anti-sigma B factor antagonist
MRIRTETGSGKHLVNLAGRFDAHEVNTFRLALEPLLADVGATVRIDLADVVFVDSSALAELLRAQRAATAHGGDLVLVDVSDPVRVILELTALGPVFTTEVNGAVRAGTVAGG